MRVFNSLTRKVEEFVPMKPPVVKMYTCGPTVYSYPTIGNWRTYVTSDLLIRTLKYLDYQVDFVMNLTDVGHLTGDNSGDADTGEDRLEKAAQKEKKTAWEIAKFYSEDFEGGFSKLNLIKPMIFSKATDHIGEQIKLIGEIEEKGFTYKISDGIYFDVAGYERAGNIYGELSNLDEIKRGARIEVNQEKKDPRDFALWKFSYKGGRSLDFARDDTPKRQMEWESPWGVGFPGWHIECSAMSMKYLGDQLDIHVGGEDLKSTHHPNEIAQSEAVTGKKPFCRYWVHGAFLLVDGGRMGKSEGNAYTIADIESRGYSPLALRYFFLTGQYRKQINFTWEALDGAATALSRLKGEVMSFRLASLKLRRSGPKRRNLLDEKRSLEHTRDDKVVTEREKFKEAIGDDLNMPQALAVVWEVVKSDLPDGDKYELLLKFDEVLGLNLKNFWRSQISLRKTKTQDFRQRRTGKNSRQISDEVKKLLEKRETLRREKKFEEADKVREEIEKLGHRVEDDKLEG